MGRFGRFGGGGGGSGGGGIYTLTEAAILAVGDFVRVNGDGVLVAPDNDLLSGTLTVPTASSLPSAAANSYVVFLVLDQGLAYYSNGTIWKVLGGIGMLDVYGTSKAVVFPNTSLTWTVADNGSGLVQATASGAHGLTQAVCVTAGPTYLHSIATQNGWTADALYLISSVTDAGTTLVLNTPYAGKGVPLFTGPATSATIYTKTLPALAAGGGMDMDTAWKFDKLTGDKRCIVTLGGVELLNTNQTGTSNGGQRISVLLQNNTGSQSAQTGGINSAAAGSYGTNASAGIETTIDTSIEQVLKARVSAITNNRMQLVSARTRIF